MKQRCLSPALELPPAGSLFRDIKSMLMVVQHYPADETDCLHGKKVLTQCAVPAFYNVARNVQFCLATRNQISNLPTSTRLKRFGLCLAAQSGR
jgi:hypothetical protein